MLKTAEIVVPKISDTGLFDGKLVLYEAFLGMIHPITVKDYPGWRRHNNKRWYGGLTGAGNIDPLKEVPYSAVLRESNGMVQLVAVNKDVFETDRAEDYKKNGWEFSESDPSILLLAKYYKRGEDRGKIVISRNSDLEAPVRLKEKGARRAELHDGLTASLVRRIAFEELVKVIFSADPKGYPARHVLTSPVWRHYNVLQDQAEYIGGVRK